MYLSCPIRTFRRNAGAHCLPTVNSHSLLCHTTHSLALALSLSLRLVLPHSLRTSLTAQKALHSFAHCSSASPSLLHCSAPLDPNASSPPPHPRARTHTHTTSAQPPWVPLLSLLISGVVFSHLRSHTPLLPAPLSNLFYHWKDKSNLQG